MPPISALWVDEGHTAAGFGFGSGRPGRRRRPDLPVSLIAAGLAVTPGVRRADSPPSAVDVASVSSAPLGEIVERTLEVSDNQAAEVLARHVGAGRAAGGLLRGGRRVRARGAAPARRTDRRATAVRRQRALPPATGSRPATLAGVLRLAGAARPPRAAARADRPAGRRLHRVAAVPLRRGARRRPVGGSAPRPARSPASTDWPARSTTRAARGWPSWSSPTGCGLPQDAARPRP